MNSHVLGGRSLGMALGAVILAASSALAQSSSPSGTQYPYWGTAPQGYSGSQVTVPVPGMPPNIISNASRAPAPTGSGTAIGGGYSPPYLTSRDIALPQGQRGEANNKAHIWLRVPQNAEVWVNGVKTKQTGETRYYYSPPLQPGKKYSYQMRVRWQKDGQPVEETQSILVHAGATIRHDFTNPSK